VVYCSYNTRLAVQETLPTEPADIARRIVDLLADRQAEDVVLLDISLPQMDGTEVLAWIREQDELKHLPVIALTAHAMAGDRDKYLAAGFNDYVTKPIIDEDVLIEAIERCLSLTG